MFFVLCALMIIAGAALFVNGARSGHVAVFAVGGLLGAFGIICLLVGSIVMAIGTDDSCDGCYGAPVRMVGVP